MAAGWWLADSSREEIARRIREQAREIERLKREKAAIERERDQLRDERDRLERERDRLRDELETARRAAKRQAAPFSKGAPTPTPRRPGRKLGRAYGPRVWRPVPAHIDAVVEVLPPAACPTCGGAVGTERVDVQYQADLPPFRPQVTAFQIHVGRCRRCGRRVHGRDRQQTSTATGAAASQVGPRALAYVRPATARSARPPGQPPAESAPDRCRPQPARASTPRLIAPPRPSPRPRSCPPTR